MPISRAVIAASTLPLLVVGASLAARPSADDGHTASGSSAAESSGSIACDAVRGQTGKVVCLANAFQETLTAEQRTTLLTTFDATKVVRWSNIPCGSACRNGVQFSALTSRQLEAALAVARAALSEQGYATFTGIRKADTYLAAQPRRAAVFGEAMYFIAFLGTPSTTSPWMLQLGGHHYAMNITYGPTASSTPVFVGVEPQSFTLEGTTYAPVNTRRDAIYGMVQSLDQTQLAAAKLAVSFDDVVAGRGKDGRFPAQEGLLVSSLNAAQRTAVKNAIRGWVEDAPGELSSALMGDYTSDAALAQTRIAWSGATTPTVAGSYVRIDGPRLWIEFVCQNGIVFPDQIHFHTIWRDKEKDYGGSFRF